MAGNAFIRSLTVTLLLGLIALPVLAQETNTGLILNWKLNEGTGTTTADSVGSATGTLVNSPTWTNGMQSNGLYFASNTTMPYVSATLDAGIMRTGYETSNWTISCWFRTDQWPMRTSECYLWGRVGTHGGLNVYSNAGLTYIQFRYRLLSTSSNIDYQLNFLDNRWYHAVVTHSNRTAMLYINGSKVGQTTIGSSDQYYGYSSTFYLGWINNTAYGYTGALDEIKIWNRALTAADIAFMYNPPPPSVLLSGRIVTPDGFPISGATVFVSNNYWNRSGRFTDTDGRFTMEVPTSSNLTLNLVPPANVTLTSLSTNLTTPVSNFTLEWTNAIAASSATFTVTAPGQFFTAKGNPFSLVVNKTNAGAEKVIVRAIRANAGDSFSLFSQTASSKTVLVQVPASEIRKLLNTGAYIIETRVIPQGRSEADLDIPAVRKLVIIAQ